MTLKTCFYLTVDIIKRFPVQIPHGKHTFFYTFFKFLNKTFSLIYEKGFIIHVKISQ